MERGNFGGGVGDYFNTHFLELIDKEKKDQILNYQTVAEAYAGVSKLLTSKGFKPNLIIAPIDFIYRDTSQFDAIPTFTKIYGNSAKLTNHSGMIDDDVWIVTHYNEDWKDEIIICNFEKAFQLQMGEDDTRMGNQVEINVREFTEEECIEQLAKHYSYWSDNEKLSREEAIAKLKSTVLVEMTYNLNLEVIDKEAFEIVKIENNGIFRS